MTTVTTVTHVIFDMDGLLLNTEDLYSEAFQKVTSSFGKDYTWDLKVTLMGKRASESAETVVESLELPLTPEEFQRRCEAHFRELFPRSTLMPGAERLLRHLARHGVPFALATSSSEDNADLKTAHHADLFALFSHRVFGSSDLDVRRGKPAPDIFAVCASRFADPPSASRCLVFEDAPNGVAAALAAGMRVVMVPDPRLDPSLAAGATLVLPSLRDFVPETFGLPPY